MLAESIALGSTERRVPGYVAIIFVNLGGWKVLGDKVRRFGESGHFGKVLRRRGLGGCLRGSAVNIELNCIVLMLHHQTSLSFFICAPSLLGRY